jgi:hypothetical protein
MLSCSLTYNGSGVQTRVTVSAAVVLLDAAHAIAQSSELPSAQQSHFRFSWYCQIE